MCSASCETVSPNDEGGEPVHRIISLGHDHPTRGDMKANNYLRRIALPTAVVVLAVASGGFVWIRRARQQHDRDVVAAFVATARKGQEAAPCDVAVERVAEASQEANQLRPLACTSPPSDAERQHVVDAYTDLAKRYKSIAEAVARFDFAASNATLDLTAGLGDIYDAELKRSAEDARAALARREHVTATTMADWRNLSQAVNRHAARLDAALVHGDKAACAGLEQGPAAKSPAEILVSCHKNFDQSRGDLAAKLAELEHLTQR
jgi:hypothetical protein